MSAHLLAQTGTVKAYGETRRDAARLQSGVSDFL